MFNIGPAELLIIGLVLLIAVGPEQLPSVIRRVGSTVAQARSMTDGLRSEFMAGLDEIERATDVERWSEPEPTKRSTTSTTEPASTGDTGDTEALESNDLDSNDLDSDGAEPDGPEPDGVGENPSDGGDPADSPAADDEAEARPVIADRLFTETPATSRDAEDGPASNGTATPAVPPSDSEPTGDAEEGAR